MSFEFILWLIFTGIFFGIIYTLDDGGTACNTNINLNTAIISQQFLSSPASASQAAACLLTPSAFAHLARVRTARSTAPLFPAPPPFLSLVPFLRASCHQTARSTRPSSLSTLPTWAT